MALIPGTRLGPYEITAQIGVGGMGEVYQATDTNLKRQVAIKVLPASVAGDAERLARFQREAEVLAALNHPNIAQIHGLEKSDGTIALVMELVEGEDLSQRIARGAIPLDDALPIAKQIAEALEAAHEQGIIHRDLKPANIKVRRDGTVKVLDFGLAKAMEPVGLMSPTLSQSPTITTPAMTQAGMILGTAAYMSPEQAKGRTVDRRADVWAFGAVLYEMLTGTRAFPGDDVSEVLASVLAREPDWTLLPRTVSPVLGTYLRRCLHKDPKQRIGDVQDVRLALEGAFESGVPQAAAPVVLPRNAVWRRALPWVVAGTFAGSLMMWTVMLPAPQPPPQSEWFAVATPATARVAPFSGVAQQLAISPDGRYIVYAATVGDTGQIYVRPTNQLEGYAVFSQNGTALSDFIFSPDSAWIVFQTASDWTWKKVSVLGGPAVTLFSGNANASRGASWAADDTIIFSHTNTGLFRGPAAGGETSALTTLDAERGELGHAWPEVLPGGEAVLFTIVRGPDAEDMELAVLDLATEERKVLFSGASHARYAATGHLVYSAGDTLSAVPFDLDRLEVTGTPVPVLEGVMTSRSGGAAFRLARDGSLVYMVNQAPATSSRTLVWVDRDGREEPIPAPARSYSFARLSPDGGRVALEINTEEGDIWTWDLAREVLSRVTNNPEADRWPIWTPDSRRVVFSSAVGGYMSLFSETVDGTETVERMTEALSNQQALFFSPDGRSLVIREVRPDTGEDIRVLSLIEDRTIGTLVGTASRERNAEVSPDGRWMAYQSNQSGRDEVYVRPFPDVDARQWQISTEGGIEPVWAPNGRELFYRSGSAIMAVPIVTGPAFSPARPQVSFEDRYVHDSSVRPWDIAQDGQRFLMIKEAGSSQSTGAPTIVLVRNWIEELKRLVPTN